MPRLSKIGYRSLLQGSETESKASDEPSISESAQDKIQIQWPQSNGPRHSIRWATWILATLIFVNVVFLTLNISKLSHPDPHSACWSNSNGKYQRPHRNLILKETSAYSPVLDAVDLDLSPQIMNGALRDNRTIFRANPSPEVDAAWDLISAEGFEIIIVPSSSISLAGKDASNAVRVPTSWNRGTDAYIAQVDVFHQIHCLNELRKEIHSDYYYGPDFERSTLHIDHKKHCIHMLLQNLMCHADVEIIQHNWVHNAKISEPQTRPFPDFNTVKMCRNFDSLLDWAKDSAVKDLRGKWRDLIVPEGVEVIEDDGYA